MYCNSCGSEIKEGQAFCSNCGAPAPQPSVQQVQPAYQQPAPQAPSAVPTAPVKASKGFAITGFIFGISTVEFCFIIFINIVSIFTGLAGIIFSILALTRKNGKLKGLAVFGLILSAFGLFVAGLMWAGMWSSDAAKLSDILFGWIYDLF